MVLMMKRNTSRSPSVSTQPCAWTTKVLRILTSLQNENIDPRPDICYG